MPEATSTRARFDEALKAGNFAVAQMLAHDLDRIDLLDALRLTLLARRRRKYERFEPMARRWLERLLHELQPSLKLVVWIAEDLENLADPGCHIFTRQESESRLRLVEETLEEKTRPPTLEEYARHGRV
jgi:hypothetical protein